jgi:hypothetical protein
MVWRQEPKFQGLRKLADAAGYLPSAPGRPPRRQDEREHDESQLERWCAQLCMDGHTPPADRPVASKAWAGEDRRQASRCPGG